MFSDNQHNPLGRFDGLGNIYDRYRPLYPAMALDWIVEKVANPMDPLLDVGSGTGILSRQLAERGLRVIGIEPNESMREQATNQANVGAIDYRSGTAESTGLPDGYAVAVVAGQTFHWCEPESALREFHRVLKPGGWVTLLWNTADISDSLTYGAWHALRSSTPEPRLVEDAHETAGQPLLTHPLFTEASKRATPNEQILDEEGLVGRMFSISYAPKECRAANRYSERLRELFQQHQKDGVVRMLYQTTVYQARRRD